MAKKKQKIMPFFKYLSVAMILVTLLTIGLFKFIDVLPTKYFILFCGILSVLTIIFMLFVLSKNHKRRAVGSFFSILYLIVLILGVVYELNTIGFLKKLGFGNYKTENYSILVLKTSEFEKLQDLDKKKIGSRPFNTEGIKKAKEKIEKKISVTFDSYEDVGELRDSLLNKKEDAILIENSILAMLVEDNEELKESYRVLYDFSIDIEVEVMKSDIDITKDSFNIFISGIDTYGAVSSVSRSDVNMVMTINPNTHQVLITSIPRDYYVLLHSKGEYDKLTHAGIYGIEESVHTVEDLLDIKIHYYVKVNFTSVIKIVDALDGVEVESKYDFTSVDGYHYNKGMNTLKGEMALSFVRERKAFTEGDRIRIENQAAMMKSMINKAMSPAIITKYNTLLDTLSKSFVTNMEMNSITKFIKKELEEMRPWNVENISLDGSNGSEYTYSYGKSKLYVMIPNQETIINAKGKIAEVYGN